MTGLDSRVTNRRRHIQEEARTTRANWDWKDEAGLKETRGMPEDENMLTGVMLESRLRAKGTAEGGVG